MQYYSKNKSIVLAALVLWLFSQGALALTVSGGGETIITGGNGDPDLGNLVPVKTVFAFNATKKKGHVDGRFECLALAPSAPGSGDLSANVMYVTGIVSELERNGRKKAVMRGLARITGLGAGEDVPFEATIGAGPTGATFSLTVTDEWGAYHHLSDSGQRKHVTVCHTPGKRVWARDEDGDGIREVHVNTIDCLWHHYR